MVQLNMKTKCKFQKTDVAYILFSSASGLTLSVATWKICGKLYFIYYNALFKFIQNIFNSAALFFGL